MSREALERSRALWNRSVLDLRSDEVLAQILDRGEMTAWRELYRMAREDSELRGRIARLVQRIPLPLPHFWLAALASLGEPVDVGATTPPYGEDGVRGRVRAAGRRRTAMAVGPAPPLPSRVQSLAKVQRIIHHVFIKKSPGDVSLFPER